MTISRQSPKREASASQIELFCHALMPYADEGTYVALRSFHDLRGDQPPFEIASVKINGEWLTPVVRRATEMATKAANAPEPIVFCPPIATFKPPANETWRARQEDLANGLALSVECDQEPSAARARLETLLGPATVVVASGGRFLSANGREEKKLHLHWRLNEPTRTPEQHRRLKELRSLACALVGGDPTAKNSVHPLRWPGSWHCKTEPTPCRIDTLNREREIDLEEAAEVLRTAIAALPIEEREHVEAGTDGEPRTDNELISAILSGSEYHAPLCALAHRYVWRGVPPAAVVQQLQGFLLGVPEEVRDLKPGSGVQRGRWQSRYDGIAELAASSEAKLRAAGGSGTLRARQMNGSAGEEPLSEDRAALVFEERHRSALLFDCDSASWLCWDGVRWKRDRVARAFHWARELARELSSNGKAGVRVAGGKTSFASGVERFARASPEFARISDDFDRDPFLFGTPSGTVDLRTGLIRAPHPGDCITRIAGVGPGDSAYCPAWLRFLREATGGDDDLMTFLQRWCGYSLTGDTREHALVFVVGPGGNGKTVFLRAVAEIMGDYAVTAAMDAFEASKNSRHPTDLAMLRGARLVTASETEDGRAWAEARIKAITGGDPITARFMRQDFFTYVPQFKLTIVGNHIPALHNVDDAARRRFNIVPFNRRPETPDPLLPDKLRDEYPAILRWMIDGCMEWQRSGLRAPSAVSNATEEYFADQDLFQQWLHECCEVKMGFEPKFQPVGDLYGSWRCYAEKAGERVGTIKSFSQEMRKRGFKYDRTGSARIFRFVSLKPSPPVTFRQEE